MVELQLPKLTTWVRFPSPAPFYFQWLMFCRLLIQGCRPTQSDRLNKCLSGLVERTVTRLTRQIKATDPRKQRVFIEMERSEDHYEPPE